MPESVKSTPLAALLAEVRACTLCTAHLPLCPRPVLRVDARASVLIIGQAPGTRVHASGIPWDDASGERLRSWMAVDGEAFYDPARFAIMPMGFCYPGKGKGGDLPPRPECAPLWHPRIRPLLPKVQLTLLIGRYAHLGYLPQARQQTLEASVRDWRAALKQGLLPLPHPSPRNNRWLRERPWFEAEVVPALRAALRQAGVSP